MSIYPENLLHDKIAYTASCDQMNLNINSNMHPYDGQCMSSGRIFVLHVPDLSELEGIELSSLTGKLSPETFDNVFET